MYYYIIFIMYYGRVSRRLCLLQSGGRPARGVEGDRRLALENLEMPLRSKQQALAEMAILLTKKKIAILLTKKKAILLTKQTSYSAN